MAQINKTFNVDDGTKMVIVIDSIDPTLQRGAGEILQSLRRAANRLSDLRFGKSREAQEMIEAWQTDRVLGSIRWDFTDVSDTLLEFSSNEGTVTITFEAPHAKQQQASSSPVFSGRSDADMYPEYSGTIPTRAPVAAKEGARQIW